MPYVDGAAQQGAGLQGLLDDLEHVGRGVPEVKVLCDAAGEVLKALGGGPPGEGLIATTHPADRQDLSLDQRDRLTLQTDRTSAWTRETDSHCRQTGRHTDRQTDWKTGRQTDREGGRQTDRQ